MGAAGPSTPGGGTPLGGGYPRSLWVRPKAGGKFWGPFFGGIVFWAPVFLVPRDPPGLKKKPGLNAGLPGRMGGHEQERPSMTCRAAHVPLLPSTPWAQAPRNPGGFFLSGIHLCIPSVLQLECAAKAEAHRSNSRSFSHSTLRCHKPVINA